MYTLSIMSYRAVTYSVTLSDWPEVRRYVFDMSAAFPSWELYTVTRDDGTLEQYVTRDEFDNYDGGR